jgi:hypothetical protein
LSLNRSPWVEPLSMFVCRSGQNLLLNGRLDKQFFH